MGRRKSDYIQDHSNDALSEPQPNGWWSWRTTTQAPKDTGDHSDCDGDGDGGTKGIAPQSRRGPHAVRMMFYGIICWFFYHNIGQLPIVLDDIIIVADIEIIETGRPVQNTTALIERYLLPNSFSSSSGRRRLRLRVSFKRNKQGKALEFVHIPKTGGTAMEWSAGARGITWGYCNFGKKGRTPGCLNPPYANRKCNGTCWHQPPQRLPEVFQNKAIFAVVRNPYARIISEFYCPWTGYQGPNHTAEALNRHIQDRIADYRNQSLEAEAVLHMLPQSTFIFGDDMERQQVHHVLFYEDLDNQLASLMQQYNLNVRLDSHVNIGTYKKDHRKLTMADLDSTSIALLNDFYGPDFDYLGYKKLDPSIAQQAHQYDQSWVKAYPAESIYMTCPRIIGQWKSNPSQEMDLSPQPETETTTDKRKKIFKKKSKLAAAAAATRRSHSNELAPPQPPDKDNSTPDTFQPSNNPEIESEVAPPQPLINNNSPDTSQPVDDPDIEAEVAPPQPHYNDNNIPDTFQPVDDNPEIEAAEVVRKTTKKKKKLMKAKVAAKEKLLKKLDKLSTNRQANHISNNMEEIPTTTVALPEAPDDNNDRSSPDTFQPTSNPLMLGEDDPLILAEVSRKTAARKKRLEAKLAGKEKHLKKVDEQLFASGARSTNMEEIPNNDSDYSIENANRGEGTPQEADEETKEGGQELVSQPESNNHGSPNNSGNSLSKAEKRLQKLMMQQEKLLRKKRLEDKLNAKEKPVVKLQDDLSDHEANTSNMEQIPNNDSDYSMENANGGEETVQEADEGTTEDGQESVSQPESNNNSSPNNSANSLSKAEKRLLKLMMQQEKLLKKKRLENKLAAKEELVEKSVDNLSDHEANTSNMEEVSTTAERTWTSNSQPPGPDDNDNRSPDIFQPTENPVILAEVAPKTPARKKRLGTKLAGKRKQQKKLDDRLFANGASTSDMEEISKEESSLPQQEEVTTDNNILIQSEYEDTTNGGEGTPQRADEGTEEGVAESVTQPETDEDSLEKRLLKQMMEQKRLLRKKKAKLAGQKKSLKKLDDKLSAIEASTNNMEETPQEEGTPTQHEEVTTVDKIHQQEEVTTVDNIQSEYDEVANGGEETPQEADKGTEGGDEVLLSEPENSNSDNSVESVEKRLQKQMMEQKKLLRKKKVKLAAKKKSLKKFDDKLSASGASTSHMEEILQEEGTRIQQEGVIMDNNILIQSEYESIANGGEETPKEADAAEGGEVSVSKPENNNDSSHNNSDNNVESVEKRLLKQMMEQKRLMRKTKVKLAPKKKSLKKLDDKLSANGASTSNMEEIPKEEGTSTQQDEVTVDKNILIQSEYDDTTTVGEETPQETDGAEVFGEVSHTDNSNSPKNSNNSMEHANGGEDNPQEADEGTEGGGKESQPDPNNNDNSVETVEQRLLKQMMEQKRLLSQLKRQRGRKKLPK